MIQQEYITLYAGRPIMNDPNIERYLLNKTQIKNLQKINITVKDLDYKIHRYLGLVSLKNKNDKFIDIVEFNKYFENKLKPNLKYESLEQLGFLLTHPRILDSLSNQEFYINKLLYKVGQFGQLCLINKHVCI